MQIWRCLIDIDLQDAQSLVGQESFRTRKLNILSWSILRQFTWICCRKQRQDWCCRPQNDSNTDFKLDQGLGKGFGSLRSPTGLCNRERETTSAWSSRTVLMNLRVYNMIKSSQALLSLLTFFKSESMYRKRTHNPANKHVVNKTNQLLVCRICMTGNTLLVTEHAYTTPKWMSKTRVCVWCVNTRICPMVWDDEGMKCVRVSNLSRLWLYSMLQWRWWSDVPLPNQVYGLRCRWYAAACCHTTSLPHKNHPSS